MRAREFITESNLVDYDGLRMSFHISSKRPQILVRALDDWDRELGRVLFNIGDNKELDPQDLEVNEKYRRQDVAKKMYDFVKSKGYAIHRSSDQTDAGAKFWNKHRGHDTVWEDTVNEMALPTDIDEHWDSMRAREFITESVTSFGDQIQSQLGLKVFNLHDHGNSIELASLIVGKDKQGQGLGSKAMKMLIDYADEHGKRITLTPGLQNKIQGTTSRGRLVKFYKQFGFKESKGRNIDYALGAGKMYRDPKIAEMALPTDWDPAALGHDKSFKSRLDYTLQRVSRLGGGSSRVAFIIPDQGRETVLKIAKNRKGMAQNEAEVDILTDGYLGRLDIVIPIVDYDKLNPQPTWLQTELANKVSKTRLRKLLHCDKSNRGLSNFTYAVHNLLGSRKNYMPDTKTIKEDLLNAGQTEQDIEIFFEYVDEVADLVNSSGLVIDDLGNASNWGEYKGKPVIIDLGFTEAIKPMYARGE